ncbi:MAG: DUF2855 family protein, partial [Chloroflexota bacterium]
HWEHPAWGKGLPGAKSTFFFAPSQAQKRVKEWGPAEFAQRTASAAQHFYQLAAQSLEIVVRTGPQAITETYTSMAEGNADPKQAFILSFND